MLLYFSNGMNAFGGNMSSIYYKVIVLFGIMGCLLSLTVTAHAQITDPTNVTGLVLWADGKDINNTGVQPANGSLITIWADKSGNGNDLLASAALAPTYNSTEFDGVNPGLRFINGKKMSAATPFAAVYDDTVSVFFVNANVTLTSNFVVNINGDNTSSNAVDGRFSFHTPWINNRVYFDAGACCGGTRLQGVFPNAVTETTLFTGVNDQPGARQLLRIDGQAFQSDSTGINARVSGGVRIGATSGHPYNGRFAEIVIYDRALTLSEIKDVECYLLLKWKPASIPPGCTTPAVVNASKTVSVWDPSASGLYAIPGSDVIYAITASHISGSAVDLDSIFIIDKIPDDVIFYNADIDDAGPETNPVKFSHTSSGLSFNYATDVKYSNLTTLPASMADCTYAPTAGYDANISYICINPSGSFQPGPTSEFTVEFRARIQ